jgi:peptide/nickel transport system permease protein
MYNVLIETIFRWPGMGRELVLSVQRRDFPIAQAIFFLMGLVVIGANFIVDLLYGYLDPRVTYE